MESFRYQKVIAWKYFSLIAAKTKSSDLVGALIGSGVHGHLTRTFGFRNLLFRWTLNYLAQQN